MAEDLRDLKILAPRATAQRITRRHFMAGSAVAMFSGSVLLAACGEDPAPSGGNGSPAAGGEIEDQLNFFHWAEYDEPPVFEYYT
jgi:hypothetical protein